ncbi:MULTISPECIES: HAD-IIA family hydrolase [Arthrobacter]|uniref:HAD-IIA family hydrolase n=2 Tax=Arthrobacter TaxID=1663 RepID=A0ABU9KQ79_9MICC|nr:HAD-IIA family hydrolase [Arthrobacter sp. YJM1]MDP5228509.1 HAD-IIA family hydrolase [Arthrobacter sp. YJM1]
MRVTGLVEAFDAILSDLDGVVYAGPSAIPGATEALSALAGRGVGLAYVTNNASRSPEQVAAHLRELGAPATPEQVVTSPQAAARLLAERIPAGSRVLITGSEALADEVRSAGLEPVWSAAEEPVAVVQGFDPGLGWKDLAEASYAVAAGILWVATNTDLSIPQARGIAPGNGTLVAAVRAATGAEPLVAGKPEVPLFHAAAARLGASHPAVVGDRLDTDILGGNRAGYATILVLTGVNTARDALNALTLERPTHLIADLGALYEPYPETVHDDGVWRVGEASAAVDGNVVTVTAVEDSLDGWRAACAAWWAAHPDEDTATSPELLWARRAGS